MMMSLMSTVFAAETTIEAFGGNYTATEEANGNYGKAESDGYLKFTTHTDSRFIFKINNPPAAIPTDGYVVYECDFVPDENLDKICLSVGTLNIIGNYITGNWINGRWNHLMIAISNKTKTNSAGTVTTNEIVATINGNPAVLGNMGAGQYANAVASKNLRVYLLSKSGTQATVAIDNQKITEVASGTPAYEMPTITNLKNGKVQPGIDVNSIASSGETVRVYDVANNIWTQKTTGVTDADDVVVVEKDGILNYFAVGDAKTWNESVLVESYDADGYSAYNRSTVITNSTQKEGLAGKKSDDKLIYLPKGGGGTDATEVNMRFTLTSGAVPSTGYVILEADVLPVGCDSIKLTLNGGDVILAGGFINVPKNVWSRVTMIYNMDADADDDEAVKVYINGDLDQTYRKGRLASTTTSFRLGFCNNSNIWDFDAQGYLDNIRLTTNTYAFSDAEVKSACTGGLTEGKTAANSIVDGNDIFVTATDAEGVTEGTVLNSSQTAISSGSLTECTLAVRSAASFLTAQPEGIEQMRSYYIHSYTDGGIGIDYADGGNSVIKAVYAGNTGILLLAEYDTNKALKNVTIADSAVNGILKNQINISDNTKYVRAYAWDSLNGLKPLVNTYGEIVK